MRFTATHRVGGGERSSARGYDLNLFFFSSRRRHTRCSRDWSSDVCSSDLLTEFSGPPAIFFDNSISLSIPIYRIGNLIEIVIDKHFIVDHTEPHTCSGEHYF